MLSLPLFKAEVLAPIEQVTPRECSATCTLCVGIEPVGRVSHEAVGDPGGILLVGDMPTQVEARSSMLPFSTQAGKWIASAISRLTGLPIAIDYAVKCALGKAKIAEATISNCRPHLAQTISEVQPRVIMVFGQVACASVLGRKFNASMTTGGISFTSEGTPVIVYPPIAAITSNKFMRKSFEDSLPWALGNHETPPWRVSYRMVETASDAEEACEELASARWFAFDTETDGLTFTDYFRINTLAACSEGSREAWVWDVGALCRAETTAPLIRLMLDPKARKVAQNLKFDNHAVNHYFGIKMVGQHICTLLWARLIDAECDGRLEVLAEKVGMGGHKAEAQRALLAASKTIREVQDGKREPANAREEQALQYATVSDKTWAYGVLDEEIRNRYCARDCVTTVMLAELQERQIAPEQLQHWNKLVSKTTEATQQVEAWGLPVNEEHLAKYETWLSTEMAGAESRLNELAGRTVNPGNNTDVHKLLFNELGMRSMKETPGGKASVDADALTMLAASAKGKAKPVISELLAWRKMAKQLSTYAAGMRPHIRGDGRVHTSLNIAGTVSGRMSSSQPNCFSGDTEVLTPDGWVAFSVLKAGTLVMQWDEGVLTFVKPLLHTQRLATSMVHITGLQTSLLVTPDHRCALRQRYSGPMHIFAAKDYPLSSEWHQLHAGAYLGGVINYKPAQLLVLAAASIDGHFTPDGLEIRTAKPWNIRSLCTALDDLGLAERYSVQPVNATLVGGVITLPHVTCHTLNAWVVSLLEDALVLGPWVFLLSSETRVLFLHMLTRWSSISGSYQTKHKISADFVHAMCVLSGRKTTCVLVTHPYLPEFWEVRIYSHSHTMTNKVTKETVPGVQDVYCLTVPSSYVMVRHAGCVTVTQQCQNIPRARGNEEGRMARNVFCATPGHVLLELDYCLAAGTLVDTPTGHRRIEDLRVDDLVFSFNHRTQKPDCSHVSATANTGVQPTLVVELDNGEMVRCTENHRWLLVDGTEVRAGKLEVGAQLLATSSARHITQMFYDGLYAQTYDIEVARDHNFALAAGVFVHNSQLEIRVAAGLSGDKKMQAILAEGVDFHLRTAQMVSHAAWGISPEQVTKTHRDAGKTINFATLYGQGIPRLAHAMNCTHAVAERVQGAIFSEFKDLVKWIRECVQWAKAHGETFTEWEGLRARRRPLIAIAGTDLKAAGSAERSSYNSRIQGASSDYCLASVVDCVDWLLGDCVPAELVLTVHDSLLFNVREDVLEEVARRAEQIMASRKCNGVQLSVDKSVGRSWGQLAEYKFDEQLVLEGTGHSKYHLQG